MKRWLIVVFVFAFALSCSKEKDRDDYVAKIGNVKLTEEDVRVRFKNLPPSAMQFFQGPNGMKVFVDELVKREVLYLAAKQKGIERNEEVVKKLSDTKKDIVVTYFLDQEIKAAAVVTEKDVQNYYDSHKNEFTLKDNGSAIMEFDQLKEDITRKVRAEKRKAAFNKILESSMKSFKTEINEKALEKLTRSGISSGSFKSSYGHQ